MCFLAIHTSLENATTYNQLDIKERKLTILYLTSKLYTTLLRSSENNVSSDSSPCSQTTNVSSSYLFHTLGLSGVLSVASFSENSIYTSAIRRERGYTLYLLIINVLVLKAC